MGKAAGGNSYRISIVKTYETNIQNGEMLSTQYGPMYLS